MDFGNLAEFLNQPHAGKGGQVNTITFGNFFKWLKKNYDHIEKNRIHTKAIARPMGYSSECSRTDDFRTADWSEIVEYPELTLQQTQELLATAPNIFE